MEPSRQQFEQRESERSSERTSAPTPPRFDPAFRQRLYELLRWRRDVRR